MASKLGILFAELKRRKVGRAALVYAVVGFGVIEGADIIFPRLAFPYWAVDFVLWVVLLGFPVALILSWFFEITPEGLQRTPDLTPDQLTAQAPVKWSLGSWVFIGTACLVVLAVAFLSVPRASAIDFNERDWVLIADLENNTGDELFEGSLIHAFTVALDQSLFVNVFPRNRVREVLQRMQLDSVPRIDVPLALEIAERELITAVLALTISEVGGTYLLSTSLFDPYTGTALRTQQVEADGREEILGALGELATAVRRDLGESLRQIRQRAVPLPKATTPSLEALKLYFDGSNAWSQSRWQEAQALWTRAAELDPGFAWVNASLGMAANWLDSGEGAQEFFDRALSQLDRVTEKERLWITALVAEGAPEVTAYQTYLRQYPDDRDGWYNLGNVLRYRGRMEEAMAAYERTLEIDSLYTWAHTNLAVGLDGLGRFEDAAAHFDQAFQIQPGGAAIWQGDVNRISGFVLVKQGDTARARERFELLLAGDESARANGLRSLALLEMYRGRHSSAIDLLEEAVVLNQRSDAPLSEFRNRMYLAQAFRTKGMAAPLARELALGQELAEEGGWGPDWVQFLTGHLVATGDMSGARAWLDRWIQAGLAESDQAWNVGLLRGEIALVEGDFPTAVASMELADQLRRPAVGRVKEALGRAYYSNGQFEESVTAFRDAIRLKHLGDESQEPWALAHYRLGLVLEETGDTAQARAYFQQFLELWGGGDEGLEGVADARRRIG